MIDIVAVDGGADGGCEHLRPNCDLTVYAFDPIDGEGDRKVLLGDYCGEQTFHYCNHTQASSTYHINRSVTDRWRWSATLGRDLMVEAEDRVYRVTTLDVWAKDAGVRRVDFIKLNVQGAELDVLRGAHKLLPGVLGMLLEVSFVESYVGRPLFAEVDVFARDAGFTFFDFMWPHWLGRVANVGMPGEVEPGRRVGQCIEGHALYLRDPIARGDKCKWPREDLHRLAVIAETYDQIEFAGEVLSFSPEVADLSAELRERWLRRAGVTT